MGGGNSYNPQPVPDWQKPLTSFFTRDPNAPPPKMKKVEDLEDDEGMEVDEEKGEKVKDKGKGKGKGKSTKKTEDEENEAPETKEEEEVEEKKPQKNGLISDS